MKKILSIILAVTMLLAVTSVAAGAAEPIIEPLKRITVTASAESNPVLKFVPEETKTYLVTSYAPDGIDPYCYIESEYETYYIDDTGGALNFSEEYEFETGVEYYFTICTYADEDVTFDIALECNHDWEDGLCLECGIVCDHETEGTRFGICLCGKVADVAEISLGDTLADTFDGFDPIFVKFTPEEDVAAVFYSKVSAEQPFADVQAFIYDQNGNQLANDDDFGASMNFAIWYEFKAGKTYLLEIQTFYEDVILEFSLVKAAHTVDGAEHMIEFTEEEYGTCQALSYTEGFYCAECDEYLAGHIENGYGYCEDYDEDECCDYCGESMSADNEDPEDPEDPENPDEPGTPDEPADDVCEHCGKAHTSFFHGIICFLTRIFSFIKSLFA